MTTTPRIRLGMIGGGEGAFIGAVHRSAAAIDGLYTLTAGAFSSTPDKSIRSGIALGLPPDRVYPTWQAMLDAELKRPAHDRIELVSIVTPNHAHYELAKAFAQAGFHVICDKPLVTTSAQATDLAAVVAKSGVLFGVTYNYSGYPLIKEAAALIASGTIGDIRKVFVEYHQGWLATSLEASGQKQADWRTDPARAGAGGAVGDIGTHAEHLLTSVTGLHIQSLCADLSSYVPGRKLDDDASILLRFANGAKGVITVSQICIGEENNLTLRIHGTTGSISWRQEDPNQLTLCTLEGHRRIITRGTTSSPAAANATRIPSGHPEGFIEAFANIYKSMAHAIHASRTGAPHQPDYPTIHDGIRGVTFIETVVQSSLQGAKWLPFPQ